MKRKLKKLFLLYLLVVICCGIISSFVVYNWVSSGKVISIGYRAVTSDILNLPQNAEPNISDEKIELTCIKCDEEQRKKYFKFGNQYELFIQPFFIKEKITGFFKAARIEVPVAALMILELATTLPKWPMLPCVLTLGLIPGKSAELHADIQGYLVDTSTKKSIKLSSITAKGQMWNSFLFLPFADENSSQKIEQDLLKNATSFYLKEAADLLYNKNISEDAWVCQNYWVYKDYEKCIKQQKSNSNESLSYSDLMGFVYNSQINVSELYQFREKIKNLTQEEQCNFLHKVFEKRCESLPKELYEQLIASYKTSCNTEHLDKWDSLLSSKQDVINFMERNPDREYDLGQDMTVLIYDEQMYNADFVFKLYKGLVIGRKVYYDASEPGEHNHRFDVNDSVEKDAFKKGMCDGIFYWHVISDGIRFDSTNQQPIPTGKNFWINRQE